MGTSGSTIASLVTNGLATPLSALPRSRSLTRSSWSGLGGTNAVRDVATFTAQQKGYVTIYPKAAATYNVYLDPKPVLT